MGKTLTNLREPLKSWLQRDSIEVCPHFNMLTAQGTLVSGWLASQTDMLDDYAEDDYDAYYYAPGDE